MHHVCGGLRSLRPVPLSENLHPVMALRSFKGTSGLQSGAALPADACISRGSGRAAVTVMQTSDRLRGADGVHTGVDVWAAAPKMDTRCRYRAARSLQCRGCCINPELMPVRRGIWLGDVYDD